MDAPRVTFSSEGVELVSHLWVPAGTAGHGDGPGRPGIVFTGPLSGVKEQVIDLYDQPAYVTPAVEAAVRWFTRWL
jgi:hypothetical protein